MGNTHFAAGERGTSGASVPEAAAHMPLVYARSSIAERIGNAIPLTISVLLASSLFWGPFIAPTVLAVALVAFFTYWVIRSYSVAVACVVGMFRLRSWKRTNWLVRYCQWLPDHPNSPAWEWPRHMVIIPNYKEDEAGLARTIGSLAAQENAKQLVVVLAMEDREPGNREKSGRLVQQFGHHFADMFSTHHPHGLPGETPGKGSNEAWAAREAQIRLIEQGGESIDRFTVTSCDADAVFHPRHFAALNYLFLTNENRYRTFWQPAIFNSNNIWDIPAPLRMPDGLSGVNRLSNLVLPGSVKFPTSCYSLSWRMLAEVDYWDEEVIPEDWHLYLKACYTLGDEVHVEGLFLPLGNDCVLTDGYFKTLRAHYAQSVRHAWGASDSPYAWRAAARRDLPLSFPRKVLLAMTVTKVHTLWAAQWYIITLGSHMPEIISRHFGGTMPSWWLWRDIQLPGPSWRVTEMLQGDFSDPVGPLVTLGICSALVYFCLFPLLVLIGFEYRARGPRPAYVSKKAAAAGFLMWPLMAVITFFFASLPAFHAQWKLASGKGLIYRVAEKGSRRMVPAPSLPSVGVVPEPATSEVMLGGGGQ